MLRKLLSHAAIYGLAAQLPRLAGVLALPIITPYLTPADYGVAGIVTAYVTALGIVQSLGLSLVIVNAFVKHPTRYKWVWRQLHGFLIIWSVVYSIALALVLYFGMPAEAHEDYLVIVLLLIIPALFFNHTTFFGSFLYRLQQRPVLIAMQSFTVGVLTILLNIYFITTLRLGYMGWFYSGFIGSIVGFLFFVYPVYWQEQLWPIIKFKKYRISSSLRMSLPAMPYYLSTFLLDASDKVVMDLLSVPMRKIGVYNIASSFGLYFSAATQAVVQAANPFFLQLHADKSLGSAQVQLRRITSVLQTLFLAVTFLLSLWMREIFQFLIKNDNLQQGYPLAAIILMGYNYRPMYLVVESWHIYHGRASKLWKVSFVAGVANIILNLALVPLFGIEAAAFTTFASLMYMGYSGFLLNDFREMQNINYYPWLWLAVTVLLLLGVYFAVDAPYILKMFISIGIIAVGVTTVGIYYFSSRREDTKS